MSHKKRFDRLLHLAVPPATVGSGSSGDTARMMAARGMRFVTSDAAVEYWDDVSRTWYEPITKTIRRAPVMFDSEREKQEAEWPLEKLEARWADLRKSPTET